MRLNRIWLEEACRATSICFKTQYLDMADIALHSDPQFLLKIEETKDILENLECNADKFSSNQMKVIEDLGINEYINSYAKPYIKCYLNKDEIENITALCEWSTKLEKESIIDLLKFSYIRQRLSFISIDKSLFCEYIYKYKGISIIKDTDNISVCFFKKILSEKSSVKAKFFIDISEYKKKETLEEKIETLYRIGITNKGLIAFLLYDEKKRDHSYTALGRALYPSKSNSADKDLREKIQKEMQEARETFDIIYV